MSDGPSTVTNVADDKFAGYNINDSDRALVQATAERLLTLPFAAWNFGDSVGFEALIVASDLTGDTRYISFAHGFMRAWAARREPFRRLDATAPGYAMVEVARRTGDSSLVEALTDLAYYLQGRTKLNGLYETWEHSPLIRPYGPIELQPSEAALLSNPPPGVFLDCLHFDPPFLTALGALIEDEAMIEDGVGQALGYIETLQHGEGLFDHFVMRGHSRRFGPGWGRGQGWAILGLLDVLDVLDDGHAAVPKIKESARALIGAMIPYQDEAGHWPSVVDRPDSVPEASTAAFMGAGFLRAHRMGIVGEEGRDAGLLAVEGARQACATGPLAPTSAAVMACTEPEHYCHVPTGFVVPWGEGPLVLAIGAFVEGNYSS